MWWVIGVLTILIGALFVRSLCAQDDITQLEFRIERQLGSITNADVQNRTAIYERLEFLFNREEYEALAAELPEHTGEAWKLRLDGMFESARDLISEADARRKIEESIIRRYKAEHKKKK